jgi:hypothetical protein
MGKNEATTWQVGEDRGWRRKWPVPVALSPGRPYFCPRLSLFGRDDEWAGDADDH